MKPIQRLIFLAILLISNSSIAAFIEKITTNSPEVLSDIPNNNSYTPAITPDGRFVVFTSSASNLVPGDSNDANDIFVYDRETGITERVAIDSNGNQANRSSLNPSISADGRYVLFSSFASNLVAGDTNGELDVFVHNRGTGATKRVSVDSFGNQGNGYSGNYSAISADGRYVTFYSRASNLVTDDTNETSDIFVHDRNIGTTVRVSVNSEGNQANGRSLKSAISENGRYVFFQSSADNLVPDDTNGADDIFVHDRDIHTTERVSVNSLGNQTGFDEDNGDVAISPDGRYVVFGSESSNLVEGDTNGITDIFVHDRNTGTTERVNLDSFGNQANLQGNFISISADGRYVSFGSFASNLVDGDTNGRYDAFVRDRITHTTERVSVDSSGNQFDYTSWYPVISGNGHYV
ncbi:MAG: TolB family protein, partial [Gammaproteobacteria bacterium]